MKIRGNTVGTTLKPKAALVKSENLTEEEKAIARENIGAMAKEADTELNMCNHGVENAGYINFRHSDGSPGWSELQTSPEGLTIIGKELDGSYHTMRLMNIADGTQDTDAATVGQLNAAIGDIETDLDSKTGYVTLAETILTEDANEIIWTKGANGEVLSDYKDFFIYWVGKFDVSSQISENWICRANNGEAYFGYLTVNKSSNSAGFWWKIEEIGKMPDGRTLWNYTCPEQMINLSDYSSQGLYSFKATRTGITCVNQTITKLRFGSLSTGAKMVAGSKAVLLGRKR